MSVTDPLGNEVCKTYPSATSPDAVSTSFSFNYGNSVQNITETTDGYGRQISIQKQQGSTATSYDTVSTNYGWSGNYRTVTTSQPCSASAGGRCTTVHTNYFDPLGRLYSETTASNEAITNTFSQNDVLSVLGPAPSGEHIKQVQNQYDGLGRLATSCAIESSGGTSCGQSTGSASGVVTTTTYTSATGSQTITTTRGVQSRSTTVDGLGRVTQKYTPEGGTWNYYYDSYSSCPTGYRGVSGQLAAVADPNGNLLCYAYDSLNRVTGVNADGTTCRHYYYDNSTGYSGTIPSGISITNSAGRLVEAATDACSSGTLITDEWFSYDQDGHVTTQWESTPHSGQYYKSTATFFGNGAISSLSLASPTIMTSTYGLDGEGRLSSLTAREEETAGHIHLMGPATTLISNTTYNAASQPTNIYVGTGTDRDVYNYDSNTGRMINWTFDVGAQNEGGSLNWNPNGSLQQLAISDGFNSTGTQTCVFGNSSVMGYDDLGRLLSDNCGSVWAQTFSYDQYDNITKIGSITWACTACYNSSNNQYNSMMGPVSYDSNGNLLNDTMHQYTWNEFSKLMTVDSSACGTNGECVTYDAFGRAVEISNGSAYTQVWYTQLGKTAFMNGSSYRYSYWPAPGGSTLLDEPEGYHFQHKDWLGNARISSDVVGQTVIADRAFAPYGEMYQNSGSTSAYELNFTGDTQDIVTGTYDTPNRELNPNQGRWISPDPAGSGWNQYAYATNPNSFVDPTGLILCGSPHYSEGSPDDPWCTGPPPSGGDGSEFGGGPLGFTGINIAFPFAYDGGDASDNPFETPNFPSDGSIGIPCDFGICGPPSGGIDNFTTPGNENTDWYTGMVPIVGPDGYWILVPANSGSPWYFTFSGGFIIGGNVILTSTAKVYVTPTVGNPANSVLYMTVGTLNEPGDVDQFVIGRGASVCGFAGFGGCETTVPGTLQTATEIGVGFPGWGISGGYTVPVQGVPGYDTPGYGP